VLINKTDVLQIQLLSSPLPVTLTIKFSLSFTISKSSHSVPANGKMSNGVPKTRVVVLFHEMTALPGRWRFHHLQPQP
jgi:hypothetical protein